MTIREIQIKNFKKIDELNLVFKPGINVIYGRNEIGKSTVIEAVNRVFLTEPAASGRDIAKLIPWSTDIKPCVKIKFENGNNEIYAVEKTFNKGSGRIFLLNDGRERLIAEGAKIQEKIFEKMGISANLESLIKLLWIDQGEVLGVFDNSLPLEARAHVRDIIRENIVSKELEMFYGSLLSEYDALIDKRSGELRKTSEYSRLNEECRKLESELAAVENELDELDENAKRLALADSFIEDLNDKVRISEEHLKNLELKKTALDGLKNKEQEFGPVKKDYLDVLRLDEDIASKGNDLALYNSHRKYCLEKKIKELCAGEKAVADARSRLAQMEEEALKLKDFDEKLADEYERLLHETEKMRIILEKSPFKIRLRPAGKVSLRIKNGPEEEKNIELSEETLINVAGKFSLNYEKLDLEIINDVEKPDHAGLNAELSVKTGRMNELEKIFGTNDPAMIAANRKNAAGLNQERQVLAERLRSLDAGTINSELSETIKELAGLGDQKETGAVDVEKIDRQPVDNYLRFLNNKVIELGARIEGMVNLRESIIKNYGGPDELKNRYLLARDTIDTLKTQIDYLKPGNISSITDRDLGNARMEIEVTKRKIVEAGQERTRINTRLENYFTLQNEKARLESTLASQKSRLETEKNRFNAIRLLMKLIDEEKKGLEDEVLKPLEKKVTEAFSRITGSRYAGISINDNFRLSSVDASAVTGNASVNHETLSFGTREQLAFLLRLSIADFLARKDRQLMMLDDSFVNTDDGRLGVIIDLIKSYSDRIQFLIFTCREDYNAYRDEFNFIDLNAMLD